MTTKQLNSLLIKLNKKVSVNSIFLRPLSQSVDLGKSFVETPKPTDSITSSNQLYTFYFIKNEDNIYVAVVLDMYQDLHWFVSPKHQKKGHLTNALKTVILPHLFQKKIEQKISIDENAIGLKNCIASTNVAKKLGFIKLSNTEYLLKKNQFPANGIITGENVGIVDERVVEMTKKINYISRLLSGIQAEVEMKLGNTEYSKEISELVTEIYSHTLKLEDAVYEFAMSK